MIKLLKASLIFILCACNSKIDRSKGFVPKSSGNLNNITVVMPIVDWNGALGKKVRDEMGSIYEGLPIDEPQFSLKYMTSEVFKGFARQSRNIIWFQKDTIPRFQLAKDQFAKPQIVCLITGEDSDSQAFSLEENSTLLKQTILENERKEKIRRINKSPTNETSLKDRFGYHLKYPSAYKTVKDTINFIWIQKPVQKGHLNIISYNLPADALEENISNKILNIRDSIGKLYIPGRLPGSYLITEKAYRPYFYKTSLAGNKGYLTKGTWEVANDFMAGPFINYTLYNKKSKKWIVIEGFAFAPSISKRDYMFELNTIITTLKIKD
tara:strand:+ start:65 stop:1036 length:972 start_codon:yes stop_codon:yes gene_type:complete